MKAKLLLAALVALACHLTWAAFGNATKYGIMWRVDYNKTTKTATLGYDSGSAFESSSSATGAITVPTNIVISQVSYAITNIGNRAFALCANITAFTLPDSLVTIDVNAFEGCTGLESITLPGSVKVVGNLAFAGCTNLRSVTLQDGITSIGSMVFDHCTSLQGIFLPPSITTVGSSAFQGCTALEVVLAPATLTDTMKQRLAAYGDAVVYYGEGEDVVLQEDGSFVVADTSLLAKVLIAKPDAVVSGATAPGLILLIR